MVAIYGHVYSGVTRYLMRFYQEASGVMCNILYTYSTKSDSDRSCTGKVCRDGTGRERDQEAEKRLSQAITQTPGLDAGYAERGG